MASAGPVGSVCGTRGGARANDDSTSACGVRSFTTTTSEVCVFAARGKRPTMEDTHLVVHDLLLRCGQRDAASGIADACGTGRIGAHVVDLYAVFDGHAGSHVARALERTYASVLRSCIVEFGVERMADALDASFRRCDGALFAHAAAANATTANIDVAPATTTTMPTAIPFALDTGGDEASDWRRGGSTAVVVVVVDNRRVFVANAGDAEAILIRQQQQQQQQHEHREQDEQREQKEEKEKKDENGGGGDGGDGVQTTVMTVKHVPNNASEAARIQQAGGFIVFGRVNGTLAVSRSFGDFEYRGFPRHEDDDDDDKGIVDEALGNSLIIAVPHTAAYDVQEGDVLLVACDGLFDVFPYDAAAASTVEYVLRGHGGNWAQALVNDALLGVGRARGASTDNVSAIVVRIGKGGGTSALPVQLQAGAVTATTAKPTHNKMSDSIAGMNWADVEDDDVDAQGVCGDAAMSDIDCAHSTAVRSALVAIGGDAECGEEGGNDGDNGDDNGDDDDDDDGTWNVVCKKGQMKCDFCGEVFDRHKGFSLTQRQKEPGNRKCLDCAEVARREYAAAKRGVAHSDSRSSRGGRGSAGDAKMRRI